MRINRVLILLCLEWILSGSLAQNAQKLSLEQCLEVAQSQSRVLKSGQLSVDAVKAAQGMAWEMDKTEFSLSQDPTSGGSTDNSLTVGQSFDFPTVYVARHRQLKAQTELANREYNALQKQFIARISSLYCNLDCSQNSVIVYERQDSIYARFVQMAEVKYKNGETGQLEVMNARHLQQENHVALSAEILQSQSLQRQLRDAMGVDYLVETISPAANNSREENAPYDFSQSAQGQVLEQQVEVNRKELSVARQAFAPTISLSARTQVIINGFNPYHQERALYPEGDFMGFEVGLAVPLFFGGQRSKAKSARLALERSEMELQQARQEAETSYQNALASCEQARQNLLYYEQTGHHESTEMARIAQTSYENGEIGYVEYIQALKSSIELHLNHLKAINTWQQSVIQLMSIK